MLRMPKNAVMRAVVVVALTTGGTVGLAGAMIPPEAIVAAAKAQWMSTDAGLGVSTVRPRVEVQLGTPGIVPFRVASDVPFRRVAAVTSSDEGIVRVVEGGQIAPGVTYGFAVVEGVREGFSEVVIGGVPVQVAVTTAAPPPGLSEHPRVVTPVDGAAAWGKVAISVSWWRPAANDPNPPKLSVAGRTLESVWSTTPADGPVAMAAYELDTTSMDVGSVELVPVWSAAEAGTPVNRPTTGATSTAVRLRIIRPESAMLFAGECEATYDLPPLPEERKEPKPSIGKDEKASGGEFFNNAGAVPHFRFPVDVPEGVATGQGPGWYQVILTAAGDEACTALPSAGISIDEAQYPATRSAIAMSAFHRVPIGIPMRLEPGKRVLRVDFLNDFYAANGADRNLRLDKIEVARVADAARTPAAGGSESAMMMSGEPMTAMTGAAAAGTGKAGEAMMAGGTAGPGDAAMMGAMSGGGGPGGGAVGDRWPETAALRAARGDPAVIAFAKPIDGATVAGDLEIRSVAWWPGIGEKNTPPPRTTLMLNGHAFAEQIAAAPRFVVPWSALESGENRLSLVAEGVAFTARSAEATVTARKPLASLTQTSAGNASNLFFRFTVHDPRWDAASRSLLSADQNPPERLCFAMASNADVYLTIPANLSGEYEIDLEAKGQAFKGPPELAVSLETDGQPAAAPIGVLGVPNSWDDHKLLRGTPADKNRGVAVATLAAGPKRLKVSFINDLYEPDKGDRNVFLQAVVLRPHQEATGGDASEPARARVTYPADGQIVRAGAADAIVFELDGPGAARTAEVVIDGQPTGQIIDLRSKLGPFVAPVSLRIAPAGTHELAIRISDPRGRTFTTSATRVEAAALGQGGPTPYERCLLMLDRFGFGPDEGELAAALVMGVDDYLDARLADPADAARVRSARDLAAARYPNSSNGGDVQRRAILEAITTDNPVRARFVLWTENHFSTWIRKTESRRKADEHDRFTQLGVAPFGELLLASATSPAMLRYLDQEQSFARRLNENYAREIMELHTLGVNGGYTQDDVTTLARILTGWTTAREGFVAGVMPGEDGVGPDEYGMRESFRFDPVLGDAQARVFLGREFAPAKPEQRYPRVLTAIGILANHPSTARFVSRKIAEHYLSFPAPDDVVEALSSTFERTGGDMREVLRTLMQHPRFWSMPPQQRLAHPADFAFRLSRCAGSNDAQGVHEYLNLSGQGMFDRSTPDGYQENDSESMDSNAMLQRWKFARRLENTLIELIPSTMRTGDKPIADDEAQRTVDLIAIRLTGRLLGDASNGAAMELFRKTDGRRDDRWRATATFIASTPEAQLK
jgi:uncharacterized protein (DUF1800 family)